MTVVDDTTEAVGTGLMQAVIMLDGALELVTVPIPTPGPREVLVKVRATGICGSDLHCLAHTSELLAAAKVVTGADLFDIHKPVVMGHEFCAEVVAYGPETRGTLPPGTRVASPGFLLRDPFILLGYGGTDIPGGYAEYMLLSEDLLAPVPDHVPDEIAALAEPMTVALHAVNRGKLGPDDVPLVIGCGPIGLAVIAILKMRGIGPIVAADFSPSRREMARELGADVVVDPAEASPYESWRQVAETGDPERMARPNVLFPPGLRPAAVFECVGIPGMIQQVLAGAPACSKVIVAGVCMEPDSFLPSVAILKEIDLVFTIAFTLEEYQEVLGHLASGALQVAPMVTDRVGLAEVPEAFARLSKPGQDVKIVVVPAGH
ncbi:zinc-binding dehydrogenase [Streptomyces sp. NPDC051985]|uniref:zinc-binding dehydrogenase n=1 Tax=Streptomyces sp. NPDC051985 TaxID=3155807 RepID=UPI00342854A0